MSSIVGTQLGWDVRDTALERSLSDKEHIGDPFESVAERAQLPIEMDLLPPGRHQKRAGIIYSTMVLTDT